MSTNGHRYESVEKGEDEIGEEFGQKVEKERVKNEKWEVLEGKRTPPEPFPVGFVLKIPKIDLGQSQFVSNQSDQIRSYQINQNLKAAPNKRQFAHSRRISNAEMELPAGHPHAIPPVEYGSHSDGPAQCHLPTGQCRIGKQKGTMSERLRNNLKHSEQIESNLSANSNQNGKSNKLLVCPIKGQIKLKYFLIKNNICLYRAGVAVGIAPFQDFRNPFFLSLPAICSFDLSCTTPFLETFSALSVEFLCAFLGDGGKSPIFGHKTENENEIGLRENILYEEGKWCEWK